MGGTTLAESARHLLEQCLHVSARLESNDSGLIYMTFWKGAVRRQRKTDCLDCAFSPATTALFTVLLQKLARVSNYVQLTHDGQPKYLVGTDGARLYLGLGNYNSRSVGEISVSGGEPVKIPAPSAKMQAVDLSPDGSQVLAVDQQSITRGPLWSL